jgi:L-amino acid N-acyltransferase YncA
VEVRKARAADAEAAAAIYNEGMAERVATFETRPQTAAEFERRIGSDRYPFLVADSDGRVVGFASASSYSDFEPYAGVAEFAVYVSSGSRGQGVGRQLVEALAAAAREAGFHKLIGKVFTTNDPSIRLLARCGFREVGVHLRHGQLDGDWRDVLLVERSLSG